MSNSRVPIKFDIYRGDQYLRSETFSEPIIKIGKVASSHLRLEDEVASRMHAMVEVTSPDEIYIIDLGSASGTYVNGQRSNKARLQSGDEITIGETRIFVNVEGAESFDDNEATMAVSRDHVGVDFAAMAAEHADPSIPPGGGYAPQGASAGQGHYQQPRASAPDFGRAPQPAAQQPRKPPAAAHKGTLHGFQAPIPPGQAPQQGSFGRQPGSFAPGQQPAASFQTGSQPNPFGSRPPGSQPSPFGSQPPGQTPSPFQTGSQPNPFGNQNPFGAQPVQAAQEPIEHQYATPEPVGYDAGPYEAGGDYEGGYPGAHGHDAGSSHGHGHYEDPEQVRYGIVASGPAPSADEVETGDRALEVVIMWGDNEVLKVDHLNPVRSYYVGEATDAKGIPEADYLIGAELLGTAKQPVVVESGGTGAIVIPQGATGDITIGNDRMNIQDLIQSGRAQPSSELPGAYQYALPPGATGRVAFRGLTFVVRPVNAGKPVGIGQGGGVNLKQQVWTLASFALHGLFLAMMYFMPPGGSALSLDLLSEDARLAKYLMEPPETVEEETPDWLQNSDTPDEEGGKGKRHKDEEGQMGKESSQKTKNKYAIQGPADNTDPQMARNAAKEEAKNAGILGVLAASQGAWNSPTSPYGGETAIGYDPMSAMGALMGDQIGDNFGFGGLGLRGTGRGGGGTGEGTIGLGNVGTIGHGGGGGSGSGYGRGAGGFRGRDAKVPQIRSGNADVRGSLSKEVIRRVIQRHINEVRFCYEQELSSRPDLGGRVQVKFIVSPSGAVQAANVESSTLGATRAENCIAQAVRRWTFPAPDGGGIVIVSYPFVLENAN
ncbi:MAG TPA: AgmX/PglI C-terminal domain-containing protein [Polyangiales bacterium]|nr:AgmX/PglI C-terminal domain-containing protein [Polyangiales bacterium]